MDSDWKWYHPLLSRIDSERILKNKKIGTFLVRKSESSRSDLVLSISSESNLFHYRIKSSSKGLFLDAAEGVPQLYFSSCDELIHYYKMPDCGLPCYLTDHVPCNEVLEEEKENEDCDFSDGESELLDTVSPFFQQQLSIISGIRSDKALQDLLQEYVEKGVNIDWQKVHSGATEPPLLQQLLARAAVDLHSSLQIYLKRLEKIRELFAFGSDDYMENQNDDKVCFHEDEPLSKSFTGAPDLESILKMLNTCQTNIFKLEQKACKVFKETGGTPEIDRKQNDSNVEVEYSPLPPCQPLSPAITVSRGDHIFEVTSGPLKNKSYLSLHVKTGKLCILKSKSDEPENGVCYTPEQILQLVKSKSYKLKLTIVLENQTNKQYIFENYKSQELFCQRVQQMKIAHTKDKRTSELSVFIGTWNMGDALPSNDLSEWYKCLGIGKTKAEAFSLISSDIFAIGTQESAYHEKEWVSRVNTDLQKLFNQEFKLVTSYSLWGIRLVIFIKSGLMKLVNSLKQSTVRTGIANTLGNKGAVGVSFNVGATSLCFVNCHLTSGIEKTGRRNQNFHTILRGLDLGQLSTFDLTHSFHHLFWFGDLNYRLELEIADIIKGIMESDWETLVASDQLNKAIMNGNAFIQFEEEDLSFPPTYRYTRGTRSTYVWTKQKITGNRTNVPSYCDRVLRKSYPCLTSCNTTYGCTQNIDTSDHSPVFASFDIGLLSETMSNDQNVSADDAMKNIQLITNEAEAKILSSSTTKFILEFHSNCLEKTYSSHENSLDNHEKKIDSLYRSNSINDRRTHAYPWWVRSDLVELVPIIHDPLYLKDQHLLIAVKGSDGQESYGECVISLVPLLSGTKQTINCSLTHLGVLTGLLKMEMHMIIPGEPLHIKHSTSTIYDLISEGDEESSSEQKHIPLPVDKKMIQQVEPCEKVVEKINLIEKKDTNISKEQEKQMKAENRMSLGANTPDLNIPQVHRNRTRSMDTNQTLKDKPPIKPRRKLKEKVAKEFYTWLQSIHYEMYYNLLVDNGYDELHFFCSITPSDLKEIGIVNEKHINDIVKHAEKINAPRKNLISV